MKDDRVETKYIVIRLRKKYTFWKKVKEKTR
jgi:hypothetical protein